MTEHILKTVEPYFSAVLSGEKTFEVRRNDRAYQRGDTLVLLDTSRCECSDVACTKRRTPIRKTVTYVFAGDPSLRELGGIVPGNVVLALGEAEMPYCAECGCSTPNGSHFSHCRTQGSESQGLGTVDGEL